MLLHFSIALLLSPLLQSEGTELTIYNQGFALIKETRTMRLKMGRQTVAVEDVAQMIEPSSVAIRSLSSPGSFEVLEQNYQYDLISSAAILNKAVGGRVIFNRVLPNGAKERIAGTLLSAPTVIVGDAEGNHQQTYNGMVIRTDDGRILLDPSGEIEVASIPDGLISKPTLLWDLQSESAGDNRVELSYLSKGMSWAADYVLSLDKAGKLGSFKGWVTLNNQSGASFREAKLKLLAGDVQRVANMPQGGMAGGGYRALESAAKDNFQQEQFADYHLYTMTRPATVRNKEMKQVSLLEAVDVPVTKKLVIDAMRVYPGYRPSEGEVGTGKIKPQIRIEFKNDKASKLGMPLPMGRIKVFQRDSTGSVQMLGEEQIDHTPKDENLSLVVGHAFDIVAERKRTAFAYIRDAADKNHIRGARETFVIEVRNRKETSENVTIIERHYGEFKIVENNTDFTKLDSDTIEFNVVLKANEIRKVIYTVESYW